MLFFAVVGCANNDNIEVIEIEADSSAGFYWDYYLYLPAKMHVIGDTAYNKHMLVMPNNTGFQSDDYKEHKRAARELLDDPFSDAGKNLGVPILVPVFPRPASEGPGGNYYIQALDRNTLNAHNERDEEEYHRIDKQLVAMIDHAQDVLEQEGIKVDDQVFMTGFSASGTFTNRFLKLHPDRVQAAAVGGINGLPALPIKELEGDELIYPVGVGDLDKLANINFDIEEYKKIPQYIYMGDEDDNDALANSYSDAYGGDETELIKNVFDTEEADGDAEVIIERFNKAESFYQGLDIPAQFSIYEGVGHLIIDNMIYDVVEFFRSNADNELDEI